MTDRQSLNWISENLPIRVHGEPVVSLRTSAMPGDPEQPAIVGVEILPGHGMNTYQIQGYLPGRGVIPLLASPPLPPSGDYRLDQLPFFLGGALLVPFANRIRGEAREGGNTIEIFL